MSKTRVIQRRQMGTFKYLGSVVTGNGKDKQEIKTRRAMARSTFNNMENVLRDRPIHMGFRLNILNCYV